MQFASVPKEKKLPLAKVLARGLIESNARVAALTSVVLVLAQKQGMSRRDVERILATETEKILTKSLLRIGDTAPTDAEDLDDQGLLGK